MTRVTGEKGLSPRNISKHRPSLWRNIKNLLFTFGFFTALFYAMFYISIPFPLVVFSGMIVVLYLLISADYSMSLIEETSNAPKPKFAWGGIMLAIAMLSFLSLFLLAYIGYSGIGDYVIPLGMVNLISIFTSISIFRDLNKKCISLSSGTDWVAMTWNFIFDMSLLGIPLYAAAHLGDHPIPGKGEMMETYVFFIPTITIAVFYSLSYMPKIIDIIFTSTEDNRIQSFFRTITPNSPRGINNINRMTPKKRIPRNESQKDGLHSGSLNSAADEGSRDKNEKSGQTREEDDEDLNEIENKPQISFDDVAGMDDAIDDIRDNVIEPFLNPEYDEFNIDEENGVLLYGPPGTGKTLLAKAIAGELDFSFRKLDCGEIIQSGLGSTNKNLVKAFDQAINSQPSVLFLDEVEELVKERGSGHSGNSTLTSTFLSRMSDIKDDDEEVLIIAATNKLSELDKAAIRPGRFGTKIEVPNPDGDTRWAVFQHFSKKKKAIFKDIERDWFVNQTAGLSNASIELIVNESSKVALQEGSKTGIVDKKLIVTKEHVESVINREVEQRDQTIASEYLSEEPEISFNDVIGLDNIKNSLRRSVISPLESLDDSTETALDISTSNTILFHGTPGTGKSYLGKALAGELGYNYIYIDGSSVNERWMNASSENLSEIFEQARAVQPCVMLIDEIDSIAPERSSEHQHQDTKKTVNQFLTEIDKIQKEDVVVVGTTNHKKQVDDALVSRISTQFEFTNPDINTRVEILKHHLKERNAKIHQSINWGEIKEELNSPQPYKPRSIENIAREAVNEAWLDNQEIVTEDHIRTALVEVAPN